MRCEIDIHCACACIVFYISFQSNIVEIFIHCCVETHLRRVDDSTGYLCVVGLFVQIFCG